MKKILLAIAFIASFETVRPSCMSHFFAALGGVVVYKILIEEPQVAHCPNSLDDIKCSVQGWAKKLQRDQKFSLPELPDFSKYKEDFFKALKEYADKNQK
jgi:hypothetical protein